MTGSIITVRHGKPALSRGVLISARGYGTWWEQYDRSGLFPGEIPPDGLMDQTSQVATAFSSPMARARETASKIVNGRLDVTADALFMEAPLPPPPWWEWILLSPRLWGIVSRMYWEAGFTGARGAPAVEHKSETWTRVDRIIDALSSAAQHGDVLLCAHGYINWMISRRMKQRDWRLNTHRGGNKYWSWRVYDPA